MTMETLACILKSVKGKEVNEITVRRAIIKDLYSFKRLHLVPVRRNCDEVLEKRRQYAGWFVEQAQDSLIYVDESGFMYAMRKGYGWAPRGQRPIQGVKTTKSLNISLCAAIDEFGILYHETREVSHKAVDFKEFIGDLVDCLRASNMTNKTIILDGQLQHAQGGGFGGETARDHTLVQVSASIFPLPESHRECILHVEVLCAG